MASTARAAGITAPEATAAAALSGAGSLGSGGIVEQAGAILAIASGAAPAITGTSSFAGTVSGAGTLALAGGATSISSGAKFLQASWSISGTGASLTDQGGVSYAGAFTQGAGTTLNLASGDIFTLTGAASLRGAVAGPGGLTIRGGATSVTNTATLSVARWAVLGAATNVNVGALFLGYGGVFTLGAGATVNVAAKDTLNLTGASNLSGDIAGAGTLSIAGGAAYLLPGASVSVANWALAVGGATSILENLTYSGAFSQAAAPTLGVAANVTFTLAGVSTLKGLVKGSGALALAGRDASHRASVTLSGGATLNVANWSVRNATATIAKSLSYAGNFTAGSGATLTLSGAGAGLTLQGQSLFSGATVNGAGTLLSAGAAGLVTVSGLTIDGGISWNNVRTVDQKNGSLTLGDSSGGAATLTNGKAGTYDILDDSDIALGGTGSIGNVGLFEKTAGGGLTTIAPNIANTGSILASSGVLDLLGAISGAGVMQVKSGATLQLDASVASTQTLVYGAGGGELFLNDLAVAGAQLFHGVIHGWASGDLLDVGTAFGADAVAVFSENKGHTGGMLSVSGNGASAAISFNGLSGVVTTANFTESLDAHGAAVFAYHA